MLGGQLDILVNNAGVTRDNLAMRMKDEEGYGGSGKPTLKLHFAHPLAYVDDESPVWSVDHDHERCRRHRQSRDRANYAVRPCMGGTDGHVQSTGAGTRQSEYYREICGRRVSSHRQ